MPADTLAWIALSLIEGIGGARFKALLARFGEPAAILKADAAALREVAGIGPKLSAAIQAVDLDRTRAALARWDAQGVRALPLYHAAYPPALRNLPDPPASLFVLGEWPQDRPPAALGHAYAIVGTRQPTPEAAAGAQALAYSLAADGACIVSGLALGIDAAAHTGALAGARLTGQATLAVLGGGVLRVFPPENRALAGQIVRRGALLCECAPDAKTTTPGLVARNRLIAALIPPAERGGLIVAESALDGGAMYAARRAQSLGRRVFAFDLPASGNHALIEGGAGALDPAQARLDEARSSSLALGEQGLS